MENLANGIGEVEVAAAIRAKVEELKTLIETAQGTGLRVLVSLSGGMCEDGSSLSQGGKSVECSVKIVRTTHF